MSAARSTGRKTSPSARKKKSAAKNTGARRSGAAGTRKKVAKKKAGKKAAAPRKKTVRKKVARKAAPRKTAGTRTPVHQETKAAMAAAPPAPTGSTAFVVRYQEAKNAYAKGVTLLQKKDWEAASRAFADFLSDYGRERELAERARMYLRVCGQHLGDSAARPESFDDHYYRAVVLSNLGELDRALDTVKGALALRPKSRKAQYLKASILALRGRRRDALDALAAAVKLDDQNRIYAANDPDFSGLRDDEEFITLTTREDDEGA